MQGVYGWIEPFNIVFAAYRCGIFVPESFLFYVTFILVSDRGFKCRVHYVVLLFYNTFHLLSDFGN